MSRYFKNLKKEYEIPRQLALKSVIEQFLEDPIKLVLYLVVLIYTKIMRSKPKEVLDAVWEVDVSTKKVIS